MFVGETTHLNEKGKGNFFAGMELICGHNPVVASHLKNVSRYQKEGSWMNGHYPFPSSQYDFIRKCGGIIRSAAVKEIKNSIYFSIIGECTPDASHNEQRETFLFWFFSKSEKLIAGKLKNDPS